MALLDVRDLKIAFYDTTPPTEVVKGISFSLEAVSYTHLTLPTT